MAVAFTGPRPGEPVQELWPPVSRGQPQYKQLGPTRAIDDTRTSDAAPAWMTATNGIMPADRPEWDWITYDRKAHRRVAVTDDTMTSVDAPAWFLQDDKAQGQPRLTSRVAKYVSTGGLQVHLKPLIEVDPYRVDGNAYLLPSPKPSAAFVPSPEEKARLDGVQPRDRWGLTTSTVIGAGDTVHEFQARRPRTVDRLGLTSAADLDNPEGPIVDGFGYTARAGEANRRAERARSVGARMAGSRVGLGLGETIGGAREGLPVRDLPGGKVLMHEAPTFPYYAWRRAALPEEVVYGAPGLGRGKPKPPAGTLVGHALYHHQINHYGVAPNQHLAATKEGALAATMGRSLASTGMPGRPPTLRDPPFSWYNPKR